LENTIRLGKIEILKRGYRGIADRKDLKFSEAVLYLSTLGNGWRFPTWNEAMYIIDINSLGILFDSELRKSSSIDLYWVSFTGQDSVFPKWLDDLLDREGTDPYWNTGSKKHLKLTLDTKEEIPWIDDVDPTDYAWVLPVRSINM